MTKRMSLTAKAHQFIIKHLNAGDVAIDATVGNGHDTVFLASHIGERGFVFGFDIQQRAIDSAQTKLNNELVFKNSTLFKTSHVNMKDSIPDQYHGRIKAIMFNLGYLPGSDKAIITKVESTLTALNQAIELLTVGGIITIMAYPGHVGGEEETRRIKQWCNQLKPDDFVVEKIISSDKATAPIFFSIEKIQDKRINILNLLKKRCRLYFSIKSHSTFIGMGIL